MLYFANDPEHGGAPSKPVLLGRKLSLPNQKDSRLVAHLPIFDRKRTGCPILPVFWERVGTIPPLLRFSNRLVSPTILSAAAGYAVLCPPARRTGTRHHIAAPATRLAQNQRSA